MTVTFLSRGFDSRKMKIPLDLLGTIQSLCRDSHKLHFSISGCGKRRQAFCGLFSNICESIRLGACNLHLREIAGLKGSRQ